MKELKDELNVYRLNLAKATAELVETNKRIA